MDVKKLMVDYKDTLLTYDGIHRWESFINTPIINDNLKETTIDPVIANRYIGNLYGLLANEFKIPQQAIFINSRINGFYSSSDYNGELILKFLLPDAFETIWKHIRTTLEEIG